MALLNLGVSREQIESFCKKWKISHLALFGSAVRGDLGPDSDIDLLVTFTPDTDWTMFHHFTMEEELCLLFGREVDLVSAQALEENPNPAFKNEVLGSARQIYAA